MTRAEALAEAQRRWGPDGYAIRYPGRSLPYTVGRRLKDRDNSLIRAYGDSWEAAFADADRRAAR